MQQREFNFAAFLRSSQYITLTTRQPMITDKIPGLAGFSEIQSRFFRICGLPQISRGVGTGKRQWLASILLTLKTILTTKFRFPNIRSEA
jgi:hypothetical protein